MRELRIEGTGASKQEYRVEVNGSVQLGSKANPHSGDSADGGVAAGYVRFQGVDTYQIEGDILTVATTNDPRVLVDGSPYSPDSTGEQTDSSGTTDQTGGTTESGSAALSESERMGAASFLRTMADKIEMGDV